MLHRFDLAQTDSGRGVGAEAEHLGHQNGDRAQVLNLIHEYFGCGTLRPDRSDMTLKWEVRSLPLLLGRVVPHFHRYPLLSAKRNDFELFARICERMAGGEHRTVDGMRAIVEMAARMNPSGRRGYRPEQILESLEVKA